MMLLLPVLLLIACALIVLATRIKNRTAQSLVLIFLSVGFAFSTLQVGVRLGSELTKTNFSSGPQRAIGEVFSGLDKDLEKKDINAAKAKIKILHTRWNTTNFFSHGSMISNQDWNFMLDEILKVKATEPNQAVEPTIMAVTDCAPSSTLRASHDRGSL